MSDTKVSRRGVYYDLSISPYEFKSPYGDIFKFSSKKKLEIFTRDVPKELDKLDNAIRRNNLEDFIPEEIKTLLRRELFKAFYKKVES